MVSSRLLSLAAGVIPELIKDPARFVEVTAVAGWKATGVWFDQESWSSTTSREVKRRIDDYGLEAVDIEVIRLGRNIDTGEALILSFPHFILRKKLPSNFHICAPWQRQVISQYVLSL